MVGLTYSVGGTGNYHTNTAEEVNVADYANFEDWGDCCAIMNGGEMAHLWRTLTFNEWNFLYSIRTNASSLRGQATVAGIHGFVLLPDNWTTPTGLTWQAMPNNWTTNQYTKEQWSTMEANGAVFLPATGKRVGTKVSQVGETGNYWSSTPSGERQAYAFSFTVNSVGMSYPYRYIGYSVRLVHDCENLEAIDNVATEKTAVKVLRDGQLLIEKNGRTYNAQGAELK